MTALPLQRTDFPGVFRRGSRFVVVYRVDGRQCKQSSATLAEARAIKLARDAEVRAERRGPTLHAYALAWLTRYAGSGHDSVRENTRREYRRLLVNFALSYFDREMRVGDLDRVRVQQFVDWLTSRPGRDGRLCDRLIANAITALRLALDAAVAEGLLDANPLEAAVLPRHRRGRAWEMKERRFLTRDELARLLDKAPPKWRPLFELLASTGLRISEAIALRWSDLYLDGEVPRLQVSRAVVKGSSAHRSPDTASGWCPSRRSSPQLCTRCDLPRRPTTRSSSRVAETGRLIPEHCAAVCSSRRPRARACRASGFTHCGTPARRC